MEASGYPDSNNELESGLTETRSRVLELLKKRWDLLDERRALRIKVFASGQDRLQATLDLNTVNRELEVIDAELLKLGDNITQHISEDPPQDFFPA